MNPARRALNLVLRAAATALVLAPLAAPGQNLGRLALLSRLGEPLDAEIEVTAIPVEARDSLSAQIVPIGVFERFGVTPSPPLEVLRAAVERGADGRPVVRLKSTVPLERPAVSVIVELAWNGGRMVRQYSFNVDPPERTVAKVEAPPPAQAAETPPAAPAAPPVPPVATPAPPAATPTPPKPAVAAKPAPKPKAKVAAKVARPSPSASAAAKDGDAAAADGRVQDLERTMRELQERIDARNREIEALQREVGGTAK
jgi:pilus assembly protein FimV